MGALHTTATIKYYSYPLNVFPRLVFSRQVYPCSYRYNIFPKTERAAWRVLNNKNAIFFSEPQHRWTASFDTDRIRFQSISVMCEQRLRKVSVT